jgi:predicted dehydrogenase
MGHWVPLLREPLYILVIQSGWKGSIILEAGAITAWNIKGEEAPNDLSSATEGSGSSDPMAIDYNLHLAQIKNLVEAIWEDRDPLVTGVSGKKSLELILAIYQSSKEGKPVIL